MEALMEPNSVEILNEYSRLNAKKDTMLMVHISTNRICFRLFDQGYTYSDHKSSDY